MAFIAIILPLLAGGGVLWYTGVASHAAWWLLNDQPPVIEVTAPEGPQRGTVLLAVHLAPNDRASLASITVDGAPLAVPAQAPSVDIDTTTLPDGEHTVQLEAIDHSRRQNRGAVSLKIVTDNTAPTIALAGKPDRLRAGQPAALRINVDEPADLRATWGSETIPLIVLTPGSPSPAASPTSSGAVRTTVGLERLQGGGLSLLAILAVAPSAPANDTAMRISARDLAGNAAEIEVALPVDAPALPRQDLRVPADLAPLATGPVATEEAAQLSRLTAAITPERQWSGAFRQPFAATYARTTGFGDRRDYADGHVVYHSGYDLAAPGGTPTLASAAGSVVFTGALPQRGKTVVLDHGWGVYTIYAHLLEIQVTPGQKVAAAQPVGTVGSTGLSTGPHLHWEVRLRGVPVDPNGWIALSQNLP
ncbi:MAG TPA: M23 family metallopeptidase [Chloroflexota bacterium]|nr:M23 family metallopeptidase [Chloroflexota bacterium]